MNDRLGGLLVFQNMERKAYEGRRNDTDAGGRPQSLSARYSRFEVEPPELVLLGGVQPRVLKLGAEAGRINGNAV